MDRVAFIKVSLKLAALFRSFPLERLRSKWWKFFSAKRRGNEIGSRAPKRQVSYEGPGVGVSLLFWKFLLQSIEYSIYYEWVLN